MSASWIGFSLWIDQRIPNPDKPGLNIDDLRLINSQKVGFSDLTSFRRRPESSKFKGFWIPDQVRHDGRWTFYGTVKIEELSFVIVQDW
ncbi:MAG: hypothetical protein PVH85_01710, partial [Desulfobacterales bacterium]